MNKESVYLVGFFLSMVSALIYEVVWGRELTYVFGTSVYAVSTVLTSFMSGLAIGSYTFGRLADKTKNPFCRRPTLGPRTRTTHRRPHSVNYLKPGPTNRRAEPCYRTKPTAPHSPDG